MATIRQRKGETSGAVTRKIKATNVVPSVCPNRRAVPCIPLAPPLREVGAEEMIVTLLGVWNNPNPAPHTAILIKSVLLALAAAYAAKKVGKVSFWAILAAVAAYQIVGSLAEWGLTGSLAAALQDLRIGLPGIAVQILGGYAVLKALQKI